MWGRDTRALFLPGFGHAPPLLGPVLGPAPVGTAGPAPAVPATAPRLCKALGLTSVSLTPCVYCGISDTVKSRQTGGSEGTFLTYKGNFVPTTFIGKKCFFFLRITEVALGTISQGDGVLNGGWNFRWNRGSSFKNPL